MRSAEESSTTSREEVITTTGAPVVSNGNGNGQKLLHTLQDGLDRLPSHPELLNDEGMVRFVSQLLSVIDASLPSEEQISVTEQIRRLDNDLQRSLVEMVIAQWLETHEYLVTKNPALKAYQQQAALQAEVQRRRGLIGRAMGLLFQPAPPAGRETALAEAARLIQQCSEKERESGRLTQSITTDQQRLAGIQTEVNRILADARTEATRLEREGERAKNDLIKAGEQQKGKLVKEGEHTKEKVVGEATAESAAKTKELEGKVAELQKSLTALEQRIAELTLIKKALQEGLEITEGEYLNLTKAMAEISKTFHVINDDTLDRHFAEAKTILQTLHQKIVIPVNNLSEKYGDKKRASAVKKLREEVKATMPNYRVKFNGTSAEPLFGMWIIDKVLEILSSEETDTIQAEVEIGNLFQPFISTNYNEDFVRQLKAIIKGLQKREEKPKYDEEMEAVNKQIAGLKNQLVQGNPDNVRYIATEMAKGMCEILNTIRLIDDKFGSNARIPLTQSTLTNLDTAFADVRVNMQVPKLKLLQLIQQFKVWLELLQQEKADPKSILDQFQRLYLTVAVAIETILQDGSTQLAELVRNLNQQR